MTDPATRRAFLGTTLATAAVAAGLGAQIPVAARLAGLQDEQAVVGEVRSPTWVFVVHSVQDPYTGVLLRPAEPQAGCAMSVPTLKSATSRRFHSGLASMQSVSWGKMVLNT